MALIAALLAGGTLGIRHALEADHLAAVGTLVEDGPRTLRSGVVGVSWDLGHSVPIVTLGLAFVLFGIELPAAMRHLFEVVVGIVLVGLGVRMLVDVFGVGTRWQGDRARSPFRVASVRHGATHGHLDGDSLLVGVVHGFAGSGALVVAMASTAPALDAAIAFLGAFSFLSVLTMGVVSALWRRTLDAGFARYLEATVAVLGVGVGLFLLTEQLVGLVVF